MVKALITLSREQDWWPKLSDVCHQVDQKVELRLGDENAGCTFCCDVQQGLLQPVTGQPNNQLSVSAANMRMNNKTDQIHIQILNLGMPQQYHQLADCIPCL